MSAEEVAKAFVQHYYSTFDNNRAQISSLYQAGSSLSWEGNMISGADQIMQKLNSLPKVAHQQNTMDVQPSVSGNAMIIFISGKISIDGGNPLQFTQVFQLVAHQPGAYYIHNDIFRLIYG